MAVTRPKVLVAPLDWGLGHATRCIPVIRELQRQDAEVVIAAQGAGLHKLREAFPDIHYADLPGFRVRYPAHVPMAAAILSQVPALFRSVLKERRMLHQLAGELGITHVISDNRFGLYTSSLPCVFMTHQVHISGGNSMHRLDPVLFRLNRYWIENFDTLWIPDSGAPDGLAGKLSDPEGIRIPWRFVGILSRFEYMKTAGGKKYDIIALLSGPEPQRSVLENLLLQNLSVSGKKCLIASGTPGTGRRGTSQNVEIVPAVTDDELKELLHPDTLLICRPGYSTIMDLALLRHQKTMFIPTPGQTEQEYLAGELSRKYGYCTVKQGQSILLENIPAGKPIVSRPESDSKLLQDAVIDLLNKR